MFSFSEYPKHLIGRDPPKIMIDGISKPFAICMRSKEPVKNWPSKKWEELLRRIHDSYSVVQLGDSTEIKLHGATRLESKVEGTT